LCHGIKSRIKTKIQESDQILTRRHDEKEEAEKRGKLCGRQNQLDVR